MAWMITLSAAHLYLHRGRFTTHSHFIYFLHWDTFWTVYIFQIFFYTYSYTYVFVWSNVWYLLRRGQNSFPAGINKVILNLESWMRRLSPQRLCLPLRRPQNPLVQLLPEDPHLCPLHRESQPRRPRGSQWQHMVRVTLSEDKILSNVSMVVTFLKG